MLDVTVNGQTTLTCLSSNETKTITAAGTVFYIHTTYELVQLAASVASPYDSITIIAITFQPMSPDVLLNHPKFVFGYEASFGEDIHRTSINKFRKEWNVSYVGVLNLHTGDHVTEHEITNCQRDSHRPFCFYIDLADFGCLEEKWLNVKNKTAIAEAMNEIKANKRMSFVLVYGDNADIAEVIGDFLDGSNSFIDRYRKLLQEVFFLQFEKNTYKTFNSSQVYTKHPTRHVYNMLYILPGSIALNELLHYIHHLENHMFHQREFFEEIQKMPIASFLARFVFRVNSMYDITWNEWDWFWTDSTNAGTKNFIFKQMQNNPVFISKILDYWKSRFYVSRVQTERLKGQTTYNPLLALQSQPNCKLMEPICGPGMELVHTFYKKHYWDLSYGLFCKQCPVNFYKTKAGNTPCLPCPEYRWNNSKSTRCFDPYSDVILSVTKENMLFILVSVACILNAVLAIIVLLIFIKFKDTPIVRASNAALSFLQLVTHALMAILLIVLFYGKPTQIVCLIRPLAIGICLTLNTTINLGKTQKVIRIFESKVQMSKMTVAITKATEIFTIVIMVAIGIGIFVVFQRTGMPTTEKFHNEVTLEREIFCNNNSAVVVQFSYVLIIVIFNAIQGIRSRKLPSHYREATYVLYSAFTSCVIFVSTMGIYFAQENEHMRTILLLVVSAIINIVHFFLMYSYKVFVIICRPETNTKKAFDEKRKNKQGLAH